MKVLSILLFFTISFTKGQQISSRLPATINPSEKFIFYFHGGIVTVAGDNAINPSRPEWGKYEFRNILDSLQKRGFNVISENRKQGVNDSVYVDQLVKQINALLSNGVPERNIVTIGASAGNEIVLHGSALLDNPELKFVIMGGCWPNTYKEYTNLKLSGHFLSIIEQTDPHGSCSRIFKRRNVSSYEEIILNTGLSHGFIYRGLREWIDPVEHWFERKE
jgi:hypothetical protein